MTIAIRTRTRRDTNKRKNDSKNKNNIKDNPNAPVRSVDDFFFNVSSSH